MKCLRAWCSVKGLWMSLKAKQNPVSTEHKVTSFPWGRCPSLFPLRGFPNKRTIGGAWGRSTSDPSTARSRKVFFHSSEEVNVASNRLVKCRQSLRQNPRVSCFRAWQKASSVTQPSWSHGQAARTKPHARQSPCVMDVVCSPTYIISQATTSGMSGRFRFGAQSASHATRAKTSEGRTWRNGARPNFWRTAAAPCRWVPIDAMTKPPCRCPMMGGHP